MCLSENFEYGHREWWIAKFTFELLLFFIKLWTRMKCNHHNWPWFVWSWTFMLLLALSISWKIINNYRGSFLESTKWIQRNHKACNYDCINLNLLIELLCNQASFSIVPINSKQICSENFHVEISTNEQEKFQTPNEVFAPTDSFPVSLLYFESYNLITRYQTHWNELKWGVGLNRNRDINCLTM